MVQLIEKNPNHDGGKENKPKKKISPIKSAALVVMVVVFAVGGKYGLDKVKQGAKDRAEKASMDSLMQKERDTEKSRQERVTNNKVAYLTFDDGPNYNTEKVLDILKKHDIKATFFLVGEMVKNNPSIVKRIFSEGHIIGNHTYSHNYVFKTKAEFLDEIERTDELISGALNREYKSYFVRVPGGSMGKKIPQEAIKDNGYKSINWTSVFGDDEKGGKVNTRYVVDRVDSTTGDDQYEVVLAHGTKKVTAEALNEVIELLKSKGYIFEPLMPDSPVEFS